MGKGELLSTRFVRKMVKYRGSENDLTTIQNLDFPKETDFSEENLIL